MTAKIQTVFLHEGLISFFGAIVAKIQTLFFHDSLIFLSGNSRFFQIVRTVFYQDVWFNFILWRNGSEDL